MSVYCNLHGTQFVGNQFVAVLCTLALVSLGVTGMAGMQRGLDLDMFIEKDSYLLQTQKVPVWPILAFHQFFFCNISAIYFVDFGIFCSKLLVNPSI